MYEELIKEAREAFDRNASGYGILNTDANFEKVLKARLFEEAIKDEIRYLSEIGELEEE